MCVTAVVAPPNHVENLGNSVGQTNFPMFRIQDENTLSFSPHAVSLSHVSSLSLFSSCFDDRTQVSYHHKGQNFQSILSSNVLFWCFFSHNTPILSQPACPLNFTRPHLTPCLLPSFPSPFNISSPFHHQLPDIWTDEVAHKIPLIFCLEPCMLWEMWPGCDL